MSKGGIHKVSTQRVKELLKEWGEAKAQELLSIQYQIRAFEEKAEELYSLGKLHGTMHLSIGQEATAAGASLAIRPGHDYLLNHHRGHGHCMAWGSDVNLMMAEFMGKENGYCRGRGGSMHIADVENNNLGANGIVGGGVPMATGVGLSIQMRQTDQICLVLFGDGASNEGAFHESLNLASIWKLPVVYLCENNQYAMSMPVKRSMNIDHVSQRASAYNIPGITVDGNDVFSVYDAVAKAAGHSRSGHGPYLVECLTYRWRGHSKSDRQLYRTRDEIKEWQAQDPITRYANILVEAGILQPTHVDQIKERAYRLIDEAVEFADSSPEPDVSTILDGVYA